MYLESSNKFVMIHLEDGEVLECRERLSVLEQQLTDERFLRCHQSYLVNMDYVKNVTGDFVLIDGSAVPIRVRDRRKLADLYDSYFRTHKV